MPILSESERIKAAMAEQAARHVAKGGKVYPAPVGKSLPLLTLCANEGPIIEPCPSCRGEGRHVRKCSVWKECTRDPIGTARMNCEKCKRENLGYAPPAPHSVREERTAHPLIAESHTYASSISPYPHGTYAGRGVVICGGGKYWPSVYVTVRMLRHVGCTLPIQVWHLGAAERDDRYTTLLSPHGVEVVNSLAHPDASSCRSLAGFPGSAPFQVKSFAVLHSPFEEVLSLDADCYPCDDPTPLFACPSYRKTGGIFWPDLPSTERWTRWADWGVERFGKPCGWEVGSYVVNKSLAWRQLNMARWYDDHGDWCYGYDRHHDHGDKGSHRVGWAMFRTEPTFYATESVWRAVAFVQPGPVERRPLFVHRCRSKFSLAPVPFASTVQNGTNIRAGLPLETEAFAYLSDLHRELQ